MGVEGGDRFGGCDGAAVAGFTEAGAGCGDEGGEVVRGEEGVEDGFFADHEEGDEGPPRRGGVRGPGDEVGDLLAREGEGVGIEFVGWGVDVDAED